MLSVDRPDATGSSHISPNMPALLPGSPYSRRTSLFVNGAQPHGLGGRLSSHARCPPPWCMHLHISFIAKVKRVFGVEVQLVLNY